MSYKCSLPRMWSMLEGIPIEDRPKEEQVFWVEVAHELSRMIEYGAKAEEPELVLQSYKKMGNQYIWEFWVNDLAKPYVERDINWHGQNTSRWLYAGAIVLQDGVVSSHH